jgi:hypothetical protein
MTAPLHDSATLPHTEAARVIDRAVAEMDAAREECHRGLRHAIEQCAGEDAFEYARGAVEAYAISLECAFNQIIPLVLSQPAAWDASVGGRRQQAVYEEIDKIVADALGGLVDFGWLSRRGPGDLGRPTK